MAEDTQRFSDGTAYEQFMGRWTRAIGTIFLDWLAPPIDARWLDIGCGQTAVLRYRSRVRHAAGIVGGRSRAIGLTNGVLPPRVFSLPLPLSTRCLIPKTYGVGPQSPNSLSRRKDEQ
jgi:hypothetical protein